MKKKQLKKQINELEKTICKQTSKLATQGQDVFRLEKELRKAKDRIIFLENTTVGGLLQFNEEENKELVVSPWAGFVENFIINNKGYDIGEPK